MMFVDEVRKVMPGDILLDQIKHNIMTIARNGGNEYVIERPTEEFKLANEMQWLKDNGFIVEEWDTRPSYNRYPHITVKW